MISLMFFGTALFFPPLKWLLATFVLPAPGQGPSEATMDIGKGRKRGTGREAREERGRVD